MKKGLKKAEENCKPQEALKRNWKLRRRIMNVEKSPKKGLKILVKLIEERKIQKIFQCQPENQRKTTKLLKKLRNNWKAWIKPEKTPRKV